MWDSGRQRDEFRKAFDIVIANPPYVRTQVLGSERAQRLAARFRLSGRVDLYHAFLVAATEVLRPGGLIGIITSNRFLITDGGKAIRGFLAGQYEICEVIDLGDTRIFEAAVLPAIFIGRRRTADSRSPVGPDPRFLRIYSESNVTGQQAATPSSSLRSVLSRGEPGRFRIPEGVFELATGNLVLGKDPRQVWSLTTDQEEEWLHRVRRGSCGVFNDIAVVRVGIKTTADNVFIRSDWNALPPALQPERELLRPLLRHENARRWALPLDRPTAFRVLYPHEVSGGRRRAVALERYPKARAYLESNRARLERRHYVIEAGRNWFEIWVPQDPDAWAAPKIVFPDISPEPRFCVDLDGQVVNGDCYWITLRPRAPEDALYLLLAVANSTLMSRFHDLAFNNRLYSGRRRYITQYVAKYPYPALGHPASKELVRLIKGLVTHRSASPGLFDTSKIDAQVDGLVERAFRLTSDEGTG
jgi:hypothetical protein